MLVLILMLILAGLPLKQFEDEHEDDNDWKAVALSIPRLRKTGLRATLREWL